MSYVRKARPGTLVGPCHLSGIEEGGGVGGQCQRQQKRVVIFTFLPPRTLLLRLYQHISGLFPVFETYILIWNILQYKDTCILESRENCWGKNPRNEVGFVSGTNIVSSRDIPHPFPPTLSMSTNSQKTFLKRANSQTMWNPFFIYFLSRISSTLLFSSFI